MYKDLQKRFEENRKKWMNKIQHPLIEAMTKINIDE